MVQELCSKSRPGVNLPPPPGSMCVKILKSSFHELCGFYEFLNILLQFYFSGFDAMFISIFNIIIKSFILINTETVIDCLKIVILMIILYTD